jgi:cell wall hydrolase
MIAVSPVTGVEKITDSSSKTVDNVSNDSIDTVSNLTIGDSGKKVVSLQKTLSKYGYYTGKIDGEFGPYTEQAVKYLQTDARIKADGIVGEETNSVLRHLNILLKSDSEGYTGNSKNVDSINESKNSKSYSSTNTDSSRSYSNKSSSSSYKSSSSSIYGGSGKGVGDCWDNSEMLYKQLKAQGKDVRIIQYPTSLSSRHRSIQYYSNGKWVDYNYKENGYKKVYYATNNKNGAILIK